MESQQLSWLLHLVLGRGKKLNTWISELGEEESNLLAGSRASLFFFFFKDDFSSVARSDVMF